MITSIFDKSRPINYLFITVLLVLFFLLFHFQTNTDVITFFEVTKKFILLLLLVGSLWITNFITKKNGLSKDNSYTFLLFFVFLILFPKILSNWSLVLSNTFILLSLRRLISIQSLKSSKEKIFDASLLIFAASLFHFWCILYIFLVYVSIVFHVSRDYRNWIIPFVALFTVVVLSLFAALVFDPTLIKVFIDNIIIDLDLKYLKTVFQNIALFIYVMTSLLAFGSMFLIMKRKSLNLQASYKKVIYAFIIGLIIFFISKEKNNTLLVFTFVPVSIMLTNYIETIEKTWIKESILGIIIVASFTTYILQLL